MKDLEYSKKFITEVILLKLLYLVYIIAIPYYFLEVGLAKILISFFIMHGVISIFFVLTLIISHLTTETSFPKYDENGFLPTCYQFSMPYNELSIINAIHSHFQYLKKLGTN